LLGVIIVLAVMTIPVQEAEAGCERGSAVNKSLEKSNGKCFDRGYSKNAKNNQLALIAVVAALAWLGFVVVVAVTMLPTLQQAEAAGCPISTPAINASKARCFYP
jgi:hypothetical protein